jgi:hypothetical protein
VSYRRYTVWIFQHSTSHYALSVVFFVVPVDTNSERNQLFSMSMYQLLFVLLYFFFLLAIVLSVLYFANLHFGQV